VRLPRHLIVLAASWPPVVATTFIVSAVAGTAFGLLLLAAAHTAAVLLAVIRHLASLEIRHVDDETA